MTVSPVSRPPTIRPAGRVDHSHAERDQEHDRAAEGGGDNKAGIKPDGRVVRQLHRQSIAAHVHSQNVGGHGGVYGDCTEKRRQQHPAACADDRRQTENARDAKRRRAHIIQTVLELASQPQLVAEDLIESADDRSGGDQNHQHLIDAHS